MEGKLSLAEWTVLALLREQPAHGFALAQLTAPGGELGRIWRVPRPVVYRSLGRLVEAGLIRPESVEPGLGPQRTIYAVTAGPPGRRELAGHAGGARQGHPVAPADQAGAAVPGRLGSGRPA